MKILTTYLDTLQRQGANFCVNFGTGSNPAYLDQCKKCQGETRSSNPSLSWLWTRVHAKMRKVIPLRYKLVEIVSLSNLVENVNIIYVEMVFIY